MQPRRQKLTPRVEVGDRHADEPHLGIDERLRTAIEQFLGNRCGKPLWTIGEEQDPLVAIVAIALHEAAGRDPQAAVGASEEPPRIDGQGLGFIAFADDMDRGGEDIRHVATAAGQPLDFDLHAGADRLQRRLVTAPEARLGRALGIDPDACLLMLDDDATVSSPGDDTADTDGIRLVDRGIGHHLRDRDQSRPRILAQLAGHDQPCHCLQNDSAKAHHEPQHTLVGWA